MRRGHQVTVATTPYYKPKVEALGINFRPIRPDWDPTNPDLIRKCEDLKSSLEVLYRNIILPELKGTYEDLLSAAIDADLMIAGEVVYAAPLVAEKLALRWVSAILSPLSFFSSFDPSVTVNAPALIHLRKAGPIAYRTGTKPRPAGNPALVQSGAPPSARARTATGLRSGVPRQVFSRSCAGALLTLARPASAGLAAADVAAWFCLLRPSICRRNRILTAL